MIQVIPRLQRLHTRLMAYNLTATWCKGIRSTNAAPDALSCYPVCEPSQEDMFAAGQRTQSSPIHCGTRRVQLRK